MIQATARVLQNVVEIKLAQETWVCRPVANIQSPIVRRIAELFSTVYETYRSTAPDEVRSTVSYHPKRDEIIIQTGEQKWRTHSSSFGPMTFEYGGLNYAVHEKLTGRFTIVREEKVLATGELGFRTCTVRDAPAEVEELLANLALGYLIRNLFWEMLR